MTYPSGEIHEYYSSGVLYREFTAVDSIITYNERGYIVSNAYPDTNQEDVWEYSESGALMRQYNYVNGLVVTFEYDEEGYLLKASSDWADESVIDTTYEYDRAGNLITVVMETDGVLFGRREYRADGTLSKSVSSDRYSIHNQDGNVQKEVFNDGRCNLYRYDETGMLLIELVYGEDGSYQYCGYDCSSDTDELEVFWGQDYAACVYYDMYLEPAYAVIYEYDEDGSLISHSTVTPEEFEAYKESGK